MKPGIKRFFKYARDRHKIYLERSAGKSYPWTKDPILGKFSFTNVFRELDKTTMWFRTHVRDPLREDPRVLIATVVFRLLNRIEVGEAIFCQTMLPPRRWKGGNTVTAFDVFAATGDVSILKRAILAHKPRPPYVTGAYIISSPAGYEKLDGVLEVIRRFYHCTNYYHAQTESLDPDIGWCEAADLWRFNPGDEWNTLENAWEWFSQFDYFGKFHAYEIVTDLRHTALLDRAPDIMTWANPGPGARRGANRVMGRDKKFRPPNAQLISEMHELLLWSEHGELWPNAITLVPSDVDKWPAWEMRDVEHTLCEFDKYERTRLGEGKPRGVYRP